MKTWLALLAAIVLLALPETGHACSVCFSGRSDESRAAFLLTTLFMTGTPLALIAGAALWLRRRANQIARSASIARNSANR